MRVVVFIAGVAAWQVGGFLAAALIGIGYILVEVFLIFLTGGRGD